MDPSKGLFRRRPSTASTRSRLRTQASTSSSALSGSAVNAQSCPNSPNHSPGTRHSLGEQKIPEDEEAHHTPTPMTSSEAAEYAAAINDSKREQQQRQQTQQSKQQSQQHSQQQSQPQQKQKSPPTRARNPRVSSAGNRMTTTGAVGGGGGTGTGGITVAGGVTGGRCNRHENEKVTTSDGASGQFLQRSASTVSGLAVRPCSSPAGLHSYTGSVPSSVHGSRVDLREIDKGSAIYLGCSAPRNSSLSLSSRGSSGSSAPPSPARTPPVSPRHGVRRSASLVKKQR